MKRPDGRPDPYAALGVRRGATLEEVKTVYYALMLETHPDRLVGADPETLARAESEAPPPHGPMTFKGRRTRPAP